MGPHRPRGDGSIFGSTRSCAVTLPVSAPPTASDCALTSASTTEPASRVIGPSALSFPRTVPATSTSSSDVISPSMMSP
jgi:hypothetical protein